MKKLLITSCAVLLTSSTLFANGQALYSKCSSCHGAKGEKVAMGKSKVIADMTKAEIIETMKGYKDGTYGGPLKKLMAGQANLLSDSEIEAIANYIGK